MSSLGTTHHRDTTFTKIFVGGLPYHTSDYTLRSYFEPFGDITEAVVITDRQTGKSRGYGFVTMVDEAAAQRACKDPNPIIDGRKANVNLAYLGAKPRLPVGDILSAASAFPYALKTPGLPPAAAAVYSVGDLIGLPQLLYPSAAGTPTAAFLPATAATPTALTALPQPAPHSPVTAQTLAALGHPLFEYSTLAFAAGPQLQAAAAGFDAYQTAAGPTAGFLAHTAAPGSAAFTPIAYAAPATPVSAPGVQLGHHLAATAHYRPLSIQDRV